MVKQDNWYFNAQTIFLPVIVNWYATPGTWLIEISLSTVSQYAIFDTEERKKKCVKKRCMYFRSQIFEFLKRRLHLRD